MIPPSPASSSSSAKAPGIPPQMDSATYAERSKALAPLHFKKDKSSASDATPPAAGDRPPQTPAVCKAVMGYEAYGNLDDAREAALRDIGASVKEVTLAYFFKNLLPPLDPSIRLDDVVRRLEGGEAPALRSHEKHNRWWSAFEKEPKNAGGDEDQAYKPFEQVVKAILEASPVTPRNFAYIQLPTQYPRCTLGQVYEKPDGYGYLLHREGDSELREGREPPEMLYWRQFVVTAEFKKSDTNATEHNKCVRQLCGNMLQVMRDDPTRRFTYGLTIENLTMRLWYSSRSEIAVSAPFELMKDYRTIIRFFLSLAHPPSVADIGIDSSIVGPRQVDDYDIQVHCAHGVVRTFRTTRLIHAERARALRGSGTRVWEAKEIVNGALHGPPVVVKDTWVDFDRMREGDIVSRVKSDAAAVGVNPELLDMAFLTVVCHGDVRLTGEVADTTHTVDAKKQFLVQTPTKGDTREQNASYVSRQTNGSLIDGYGKKPELHKGIEYEKKAHYRIVFQEVGTPLRVETSLEKAYRSLRTATMALHAMHRAGWVHRDVSANNIILVGDVGKLADLEYARKEGSEQCGHRLRTASAFSLPVEAHEGAYNFTRKADDEERADSEPVVREKIPNSAKLPSLVPKVPMKVSEMPTKAKTKTEKTKLEFRYNPLHDLESLWWVAAYLISYKRISSWSSGDIEDDRDDAIRQTHNEEISELFELQRNKHLLLVSEDKYASFGARLHPSVRSIWATLGRLRTTLVELYKTLEAKPESICFRNVVQTEIHDIFYSYFVKLEGDASGIKIAPKNLGAVKRPKTDREEKRPEVIDKTTATIVRRMEVTGLKREAPNAVVQPHSKRRATIGM